MTLRRPRRSHEDDQGEDAWLITYADMVTLLLCFFIIMFAMSTPDQSQMKKISDALREGGFRSNTPMKESYDKMKEVVLEMSLGDTGYDQLIGLMKTAKATKEEPEPELDNVELGEGAFFEPGTATFNADASPMLKLIASQVMPLKDKDVTIEVEGHTADTPMANKVFPSNWELSTARAAGVVRYLVEQGFPPSKLRAIGYADTRPKVPNRNAAGKAIRDNQNLNQRVLVRMVKNKD